MRRIEPAALGGSIRVPASKSQAHRLLILAALGEKKVSLSFDGISDDIRATADCLCALGANIALTKNGAEVAPITQPPQGVRVLRCRESGSTLRFLLPVCGILDAEAVFVREGRLSERPLAPFDAELTKNGMTLTENGNELQVCGRLQSGVFTLPGNVSSQFVTALLLALSQLPQKSEIRLTSPLQSADYVKMTVQALEQFGCRVTQESACYFVGGEKSAPTQSTFSVEADYSSAAFFLCAGALSERGISVQGLNLSSAQPDRAVLDVLRAFGAEVSVREDGVFVRKNRLDPIELDCSAFPDSVPVLSVLCALASGQSRLTNCARLRLKESDRLDATAKMLTALGGNAEIVGDDLVIRGVPRLHGGIVETFADHRMAMAAAVAATACEQTVVIDNDTCVCKSYPRFWEDFEALKGASL